MSLKSDSKYPNRRAYVVKLRGDAVPDALAGRIENLVTGRQADFTSGGDLLDCFSRDLVEDGHAPSADPQGDER